MPLAPYRLARIVTLIITACIWWLVLLVVGWVFSGGNHAEHVSPITMITLATLALLLVPFFTAHGVLTNLLDAVLRERMAPPDLPEEPNTSSRSPWRAALLYTLTVGSLGAAFGYAWASGLPADTWTPGAFAWRLSQFGVLVCLVSAWLASGGAFVHEVRVPVARRRYAGELRGYLLWRHVLPHGAINAFINGAAAFALLPGPVAPGALVAAKLVVGDTLITCIVLTALLVPAVTTHARVDGRWGIMPPSAAGAPIAMSDAVLTPLLTSVGFVAVAAAVFWLSPWRLDVYQWAGYRTVIFGGYSAWLVGRVARAALHQAGASGGSAPSAAVQAAPPS